MTLHLPFSLPKSLFLVNSYSSLDAQLETTSSELPSQTAAGRISLSLLQILGRLLVCLPHHQERPWGQRPYLCLLSIQNEARYTVGTQ